MVCAFLRCTVAVCFAEAQQADKQWRPPYRVVYGGYSMEPGGRGFAALVICSDHADAVVVDEIRLERGVCSGRPSH